MDKCLVCYQEIDTGEKDYHPACAKRFFGLRQAPVLPYGKSNVDELARHNVLNNITVTGVQPKLSLGLQKKEKPRLTLMGFWGEFILKPPFNDYPGLPAMEDLTMHLAEIARLPVVPHALIRMASGELAYISRRIDRKDDRKIHMEDFCQVSGKLTEDKYRGSIEQVGKMLQRYSQRPGPDISLLFEAAVFCFLTGNSDMHLKNFSIIGVPYPAVVLAPFYDLVPSQLFVPEDREESALALNGKRSKLNRKDFLEMGETMGLVPKAVKALLDRMVFRSLDFPEIIEESFASGEHKKAYMQLVSERAERLS